MEYEAPKLKLKKRKQVDVSVKGEESDMGGELAQDGKGKKLKMAAIDVKLDDSKPAKTVKQGKITRIKSKGKEPGAVQLKFMRKDYERETGGKAKYMLEKGRLKKERELYERILKGL